MIRFARTVACAIAPVLGGCASPDPALAPSAAAAASTVAATDSAVPVDSDVPDGAEPPRPPVRAVSAAAAPVPEDTDLFDAERDILARARAVVAAGGSAPPLDGPLREALIACQVRILRGEPAAALQGALSLSGRYPQSLLAQLTVARLRMANGEYAEAGRLLSEVRDAGAGGHPELRWLIGTCMLGSGQVEEGLATLREELAAGARSAEAAAQLVDYYAAREAHGECLAILAAARQRSPGRQDLIVLQARVLRDLNRWKEARELLAGVLTVAPDAPLVRFEMLQAERALGRFEAALAHADRLLGPLSEDPWVRERLGALQQVRAELRDERDGGRRQFTVVELFAFLRAGANTNLRLSALELLVQIPGARPRALAIARAQSEPLLRVAAVRATDRGSAEFGTVLEAAAADPDPRVRGAAAARARELGAEVGIPLLLGLMEAESDPYAFRNAHDGLRSLSGPGVHLPLGGERSPEVRRDVYKAWRQRTWHQ